MCSVQEGGDNQPERKKLVRDDQKCMKCDEAPFIVIREGDPFCRACFQSYCTHKFRSAFGKSRVVRDGESVLFAFSGGPASCAILHLMQEGLSKRAQKKLRFQPTMVYIEESCILDMMEKEADDVRKDVIGLMERSGLPYHLVALEQAMDLVRCSSSGASDQPDELLSQSVEALSLKSGGRERLKDLIKNCKTLTAREELVHQLRLALLVQVAHKLGISKVIVGDTGTRLAARMISGVTQGRGAHISLETTFADNRYGDVTILRPLREFTAKEVTMYNRISGMTPVFSPSVNTKAGVHASMNQLTEQFVNGLQAEYPSTVSKICKTADKLEINIKTDSSKMCVLCQSQLDTDVGDSSALAATLFSQQLSSPAAVSKTAHDPSGSAQDTSNDPVFTLDQLTAGLCYGCQVLVRDMKDPSCLPEFVIKEATQKMKRTEMKEQIQDFLLEPGSS